MATMEPKVPRPKIHIQSVSLTLVLIAGFAPAARAQVLSVDTVSSPNSAGGTGATPGTQASSLTYGADVGVGQSDNVRLVSTDKISQTLAVTDIDFTLKEQRPLLDVQATGKFAYLDYLQHAFNNQLTGRFDGQATFAIVPQRLLWIVNDNFGQAAIDPYTAVTPSNSEDVNYFSTGPEFFARLDAINFVSVSAHYIRTQYQVSPYNSNRGSVNLSVGRDVSAAASVSLNAAFERVVFDNTILNRDFDTASGFGRYEMHGARSDFEGDVGGTRITQSGGSSTSPLARLKLSRTLSPSAKLLLTGGREATDASTSFSRPQIGPVGAGSTIGAASGSTTSSSYIENYASAGWQYARNRTTISLSAKLEKDLYPDQAAFNVNRTVTDIGIERRLTRAITVRLRIAFDRAHYPNALIASNTSSSDYRDWLGGGMLTWRPGRALEVSVRYDHTARGVAGGSSDYNENRAFLTIGYRPRSPGNLEDSSLR